MSNYLVYNGLTRKFTPNICGRNKLRPYIMAAHCTVLVTICKLLRTFAVRSFPASHTNYLIILFYKDLSTIL